MNFFSVLIALIAVTGPATAQQAAPHIAVAEAWARATAGMGTTGAVYVTLTNKGAAADRLVALSTPVAGMAEVHATVQDGDIMRMQHLDDIGVAPGASVELKPNGTHIMLTGLKGPLKEGTRFPLTLTFASGETATVDVDVRGPGAMGPGPSHRH